MVRTVNLVVEVFIDVAEDGSAQAEAMMLREPDKDVLAQGSARLGADDTGASPADDRRIAAHALADLVGSLLGSSGRASPEARP